MNLLTAVNLMMPKVGERPVTSLEVKHPTLAVLLPLIEFNTRKTLKTGWWFNKYPYEAFPNVDGEITLGDDTLSFVPDYSGVAVLRGLKLFNPETLLYTFTSSVKGTVTQYVPFDELPESAAQYIFYSSLVEAYTTDIGVTQELQIWQTLAGQGWSDLMSEHLRQMKHSTRRSRKWRKLIYALQG